MPLDREGEFDVPHLNNIYDSAPYLHNGMAPTPRGDLDALQPLRPARRDQRHDQGPAQRSDRVPEDALRRRAPMKTQQRDPRSPSLARRGLASPARRAADAAAAATAELPYVYTHWKQFTVEGRPAQRPHLRGQGRRPPGLDRHRGRPGPASTSGPGKIRSLAGEGRPALAGRSPRIDVDPKTGDVWLGLFGGGLAGFSGGRFDHWHQLNSGLVNDVVYGVAIENDNVWAATTAGASRYNTATGEWTIFTEKNAPMEEIWNYGVPLRRRQGLPRRLGQRRPRVRRRHRALEGLPRSRRRDGDRPLPRRRHRPRDHDRGELRRTGSSGSRPTSAARRYDGRHWRGYCAAGGRAAQRLQQRRQGPQRPARPGSATDKGLGVVADFPTDTWVTYTRDPETGRGRAMVTQGGEGGGDRGHAG